MKRVTIMSAPTREELELMINEYYYTTNCIISDDNTSVINKKTGKVWNKDNGYEVRRTKHRWAFVKYVDSV